MRSPAVGAQAQIPARFIVRAPGRETRIEFGKNLPAAFPRRLLKQKLLVRQTTSDRRRVEVAKLMGEIPECVITDLGVQSDDATLTLLGARDARNRSVVPGRHFQSFFDDALGKTVEHRSMSRQARALVDDLVNEPLDVVRTHGRSLV